MYYEDEFPLLPPIGLYAANIRGDGNCLFNALSDQLYGVQDQHAQIRARVIDHMRSNATSYKSFLEVYPGGGTRRNPKRKNAGSMAPVAEGPTAAEIDRVFEEHLSRMARGGTWGDNLEIQAFAREFDTNVQIYQRELAYVIQAPGGPARPFAHIAYHAWEHYSSIRNIEGPHHGMPQVKPIDLDPAMQMKLEQDARNNPISVPSWQIDALSKACPTAGHTALQQALQESRGSIDLAYERLMAADDPSRVSSQQSSSAERDADSDDEDAFYGPKKRRDRRLSKAAKALQASRANSIATGYEKYKDSLENLVNTSAPTFSFSQPGQNPASSSSSDTADDFWTPPPLRDGDTSSGSEYSPPPEPGPEPTGLKIKLSMPKRDEPSQYASKPVGVHRKKPPTAREKKDMKKQTQKRAAKERKQAVNGTKKSQPVTSGFEQANHPTNATNAMKTLWI